MWVGDTTDPDGPWGDISDFEAAQPPGTSHSATVSGVIASI